MEGGEKVAPRCPLVYVPLSPGHNQSWEEGINSGTGILPSLSSFCSQAFEGSCNVNPPSPALH